MFNRLTVGKKLIYGFTVVLIVLCIVVGLSVSGIGGIVEDAKETIYGNQLDAIMTQREVDHLNWVAKVNGLLTDDQITTLDVETDDHKCGFGAWLYSEKRKEAEKKVPALTSILKQIEDPHHQLHESAIKIGDTFVQADLHMSAELEKRKGDHLAWMHKVKDVFMDPNLNNIDVQTDDHKCGLGQWMYSDSIQTLCDHNQDFNRLCMSLEAPHRQLHKSAIHINKLLAEGRRSEAVSYYQNNTVADAHRVLEHLDEIIAWNDKRVANMQQANQIYATQTVPCLEQVQTLLHDARSAVKDNIMTETAMLRTAQATKRNLGLVSACGLIIGALLAILIARSVVRPLKRIIHALGEGADQVSAASTQLSSASQSLAEGATEQAAGLEETSSSLEEMSSQTEANADNAQQANVLATDAKRSAQQGTESMTRMSAAITDIQKSSDETAKIIKVIDEIAFQTNLLALNAAVEAARAGEAGKGFAVVAEEVRNLAMRSAEAAKNTANMIEESVKNANTGVDITREVSQVLEEIVIGIGKTTELVGNIAQASREQAQGINQVNTAVAQMDKVTQQNAANAEESASAAEELNAQSKTLNEVVRNLVTMVGGSANLSTVQTEIKIPDGQEHALTGTHHLYHQIASNSVRGERVEAPVTDLSTASVLDQDFQDFNGD